MIAAVTRRRLVARVQLCEFGVRANSENSTGAIPARPYVVMVVVAVCRNGYGRQLRVVTSTYEQ